MPEQGLRGFLRHSNRSYCHGDGSYLEVFQLVSVNIPDIFWLSEGSILIDPGRSWLILEDRVSDLSRESHQITWNISGFIATGLEFQDRSFSSSFRPDSFGFF